MAEIMRKQMGGPLGRFQHEMSDLFGRFFGDDLAMTPFTGVSSWWPAMDIAERGDAVVVRAEVPGMKPDEINISVQGNVLTISGEKKESSESKDENFYHVERRYGSFRREINLASTVDAGKIAAEYHDGILTVTLPKSEAAKPRKITVKG